MRRNLQIVAATVAAGLVVSLGAVSTANADVGPVKRISCPGVADIKKLNPDLGSASLARLDATINSCKYYEKGKTESDGYSLSVVLWDNASTPAQAEALTRASWPKDYGYPFEPKAVPALGKGAFAWADAGPYEVNWQLSPGVVASMSGVWGDKDLAPVARLFRPMMEVYTIPGERTVNGRKWRTTCESYSATARCRTEIFSSTVERTSTGYRLVNGWAFNSLTYRWADRALWKKNPLAEKGSWTSTDGRKWRTECDTTTTGRGACRSYLLTTVVGLQSGRYVQDNIWVFNNQVLFNN